MLSMHDDERVRSCPQVKVHRRRGRVSRARRLLLASLVTLTGATAVAGPAMATPQPQMPKYAFETLDNQADPTFNQLLGINQNGVIAGYFGSGAAGHPNKGYTLDPPYGQANYVNENFPGSVQTQVTGLNDKGVTVGFWADGNNADQMNNNFGFYASHGRYHEVNFPGSLIQGGVSVNQLLGVNDHDVAVGFYTDANGNNQGYTYDIGSRRFERVTINGATSLTATAINNKGDVAGFYTDANGNTHAFLRTHSGVKTLDVPGASMTQALGVNDRDEVVGDYTVGTGSSAAMHGFTWTPKGHFTTVDDPHGIGTTTINGVNDRGQLVGFYVDSAGNTDGLLATP
jgi:probable HAF family extracellular repeat protein